MLGIGPGKVYVPKSSEDYCLLPSVSYCPLPRGKKWWEKCIGGETKGEKK